MREKRQGWTEDGGQKTGDGVAHTEAIHVADKGRRIGSALKQTDILFGTGLGLLAITTGARRLRRR